jgi:small subunit ribosomal protein S30e
VKLRVFVFCLREHTMGKVHGSLARAGKVKNQTPKVAKEEKAKQPRGRALKRLKYNRRYLSKSVKIGEKVKMNPQAPGKMG